MQLKNFVKKGVLISLLSSSLLAGFDVSGGWNLLGTSQNVELILNDSLQKVYVYRDNAWFETTKILSNSGFWVKANSNTTIDFKNFDTNSTLSLYDGWNLLGSSQSLPLTDIFATYESKGHIWSYKNGSWQKLQSGNLDANSGFWIRIDKPIGDIPLALFSKGRNFYDISSDVFFEANTIFELLNQSRYYSKEESGKFESYIKLDSSSYDLNIDNNKKSNSALNPKTLAWKFNLTKSNDKKILEFSGAVKLDSNFNVEKRASGVLKITQMPDAKNPYGIFSLDVNITDVTKNPEPKAIYLESKVVDNSVVVNYNAKLTDANASLKYDMTTKNLSGDVKFKLNSIQHSYKIQFENDKFTRSDSKSRSLDYSVKLDELEKIDDKYIVLDKNGSPITINTGFAVTFVSDDVNLSGYADNWGIYRWQKNSTNSETFKSDFNTTIEKELKLYEEFTSKVVDLLNSYLEKDGVLYSDYELKVKGLSYESPTYSEDLTKYSNEYYSSYEELWSSYNSEYSYLDESYQTQIDKLWSSFWAKYENKNIDLTKFKVYAQNDNREYSYFESDGVLTKYSKNEIYLKDVVGVTFEYIGLDTFYKVIFDGSGFKKSFKYDYTLNRWVADSGTLVLKDLPMPILLWSEGLGDARIDSCKMNSSALYDCTISSDTKLLFYTSRVVTDTAPESLICSYDCYAPNSKQEFLTTDSNGSNTLDEFKYTFDKTTMKLKYKDDVVSASSVNSVNSSSLSIVLYEDRDENRNRLMCEYSGEKYPCPWNVWTLDSFYTWDFGSDAKLKTLKDSNGSFMNFDDPMTFVYTHTWENGETLKSILLYFGQGELYGVPQLCLDSKGESVNCLDSEAIAYPLYNIDPTKLEQINNKTRANSSGVNFKATSSRLVKDYSDRRAVSNLLSRDR